MAFIMIHRATAMSTPAPNASTAHAVVWVMPVVSISLPCKYWRKAGMTVRPISALARHI